MPFKNMLLEVISKNKYRHNKPNESSAAYRQVRKLLQINETKEVRKRVTERCLSAGKGTKGQKKVANCETLINKLVIT
jgi:hypothetical protein